ncbi:MAG: mannose-1-phosphate guanylyltransferase [Treponema sp.]|jgi:mannose-1-phosphate guanylyltransferase/mannose-6-phosphate isomerase|nr:mannose-1-phosphate guanylyltransferase [Treponema sp.]
MFDDCVIMAGGSGTRLWPASSVRLPKQFLPIPGGQGATFFSAAVDRALAVINREGDGRVIIIAGRSHAAHIIKACEGRPPEDLDRMVLILEPLARNTAPAIACAVSFIDWMSGEERNILVLSSDHVISPLERFVQDAAAAGDAARADKLAVFGVKPRSPETGYGYIEVEPAGLRETGESPVYGVTSFQEKPDRDRAEAFVRAGNFFWNSGMFAFSSKFIMEEFRRGAPGVIGPFGKLRAPNERSFKIERGLRTLWDWMDLREAYSGAPALSFDHAVAEKCSRIVMVRAGFAWTDAGSWDEYAALAEAAGRSQAETWRYEAENCFADSDIPVALIGVEDLIVVIRAGKNGEPGSALISKRGRSQHVREITARLKEEGRLDLL